MATRGSANRRFVMTALRNLGLSVLLWGLLALPRRCGTRVLVGEFLGLVVVGVLEPGHEQLEFGPVRQLLLWSLGDEQQSQRRPRLRRRHRLPAPAPAPILSPAPAPVAYSTLSSPAPAATPVADAFVNLGASPYPLASVDHDRERPALVQQLADRRLLRWPAAQRPSRSRPSTASSCRESSRPSS